MRSLNQWLEAYSQSHQNPINIRIHKVAVPGIYFSIIGLIWSLPPIEILGFHLNWVVIALIPALVFYAMLSIITLLMMAAFSMVCIGIVSVLGNNQIPIFEISLGLFIVLWGGQFVGHKIEGKRPSFFDDILFLLIGPVWVFRMRKLHQYKK